MCFWNNNLNPKKERKKNDTRLINACGFTNEQEVDSQKKGALNSHTNEDKITNTPNLGYMCKR